MDQNLVYTETGGGSTERIESSNALLTEQRIRDLINQIISEQMPVSVGTVMAEVEKVIYNDDDLASEGLDGKYQYVGATLVSCTISGFPINHTNFTGDPEKHKPWVLPLDPNIKNYPLVGEEVAIVNYGMQTFYFSPVNLKNNVHENSIIGFSRDHKPGETADASRVGSVIKNFPLNTSPRPTYAYPGDIVFQGRHDQSIRLGRVNAGSLENDEKDINYTESAIKLRIAQKETDGSLTNKPIKEDAQKDVASIYMLRNETVDLQVEPIISGSTERTTAGATGQIVIDSGKVTINAKGGETSKINLFSGNQVNIISRGKAKLIGSEVYLGGKNLDEGNTESAVLGESLVRLLAEWARAITSFGQEVGGATGIGNAGVDVPVINLNVGGIGLAAMMSKQLDNEISNRILSNNVFLSSKKEGTLV